MTRAAILLIVAIAALLGAGFAGWSWRGAEVAELKRQHAQALADTRAAALAEHAKTTHRIQEAQDAEFLKRTAAEADARRAAGAVERLQQHLAAERAKHEARARAAGECQAAHAAAAVLHQLLGQCAERRRELAEYADQAAAAGRTCQRAWPQE